MGGREKSKGDKKKMPQRQIACVGPFAMSGTKKKKKSLNSYESK